MNRTVGYFGDNRDLEINSKICHLHLTPRHLSVSQRIKEMYEREGWVIQIDLIVWNFEVKATIITILPNSFHNGKKGCLWEKKIDVI